nr:calcitonin receptor-like [Cherax quadricarinatus]
MLTASWPPGSCPNTWDGWQCWPATLSDTEIKRPCPSYIYHGKGPSCAKEASKRCQNAGHWYRREGKQEWSNYSSCSVEENIHRRLYVHIAAYSISVAALFPALCIFISYKQLRVHRITLHKHLFLSLLLEALGVIIFRLLQLYKNDVIQQMMYNLGGRVGSMCEAARAGSMCEAARAGSMCEAARAGSMCEAARAGSMCEAARVVNV